MQHGNDAVVQPPDFVGCGAQRAGTTWIYANLLEHPQSIDTGPKERHFFNRFAAADFTDVDITEYRRMFSRPSGAIAGEITPQYLSDFWTAPLLRRAAPDAKLFVTLRDPVERFISGRRLMRPEVFEFIFKAGMLGDEETAAGWAPEFNLSPEPLAIIAMQRGQYGAQLAHMLRHFPREQVLVLQYERIGREPERTYRQLLEHIGYDDLDFVPEGLQGRVGSLGSAPDAIDGHLRVSLTEFFRDDVISLLRDHPEAIDVALWPNFSDLA